MPASALKSALAASIPCWIAVDVRVAPDSSGTGSDDVRELIHSVLRHRITLNYAAVADGVKEEDIIDAIIGAVQTP